MNNHLANASSVSGGFGIFRNTLRVNGSGKLGTRPFPRQARPGNFNFKSNRTNSSRIHTVPTHHIFQQNVRGLKSDSALTEIIDSMRCRNGFALGLQETWRIGNEIIIEENFTFLGSGPDSQNGRGSCGVGILLSPSATNAWKAASSSTNLHNDLGPRVIAARLLVTDPTSGKHLGIFIISAYAPTADASDTLKSEFEDTLANAINRRSTGDVLVICADVNASLGRNIPTRNDDVTYASVGSYGIEHINAAGRRLRSFLELHELASLSTFFKKKYYGTWQHPRSKLQHQLDHIFIFKPDIRRFTNCESCAFGQLIDSDHRAVRCSIRFLVSLQRKRDPRAKLSRLDYTPLIDPDTKIRFADAVTSSLSKSSPADVPYAHLSNLLSTTAASLLPIRNRAVPQWFAASEVKLRDSINQRNRAFNLSHKNPTPLNRIRYLFARSDAQLQVRKAKSKWIMDKCNIVNNGFCGPKSSKASWDAVKLLKSGLIPSRRAPPPKLKRADGTFATTSEEVANVFSTHFLPYMVNVLLSTLLYYPFSCRNHVLRTLMEYPWMKKSLRQSGI